MIEFETNIPIITVLILKYIYESNQEWRHTMLLTIKHPFINTTQYCLYSSNDVPQYHW